MKSTPSRPATSNWRDQIVGADQPVPLLDGTLVPYVYLDNAASTPVLRDVKDAVDRLLPYYSSVHRGTGFKSRLSTLAYDQAHEIIGRFVGADPETTAVIFGKNTTEAINKLSYRLDLTAESVVISSQLEHHSNDLPWRSHARVVHVKATPDGRLDEDDFDRQLEAHADRIAIVAVSGASNVTGFIQPIHRLARKAHAIGVPILVDAAQLAPHRRVDMRPDDDPEHLDFVALSAHKMYAPLGTGALIGPKEFFMRCGPEYRGGGTVDVVTLDEVHWGKVPDRDEAGSPNVVGAVAMAAAAQAMMDMSMDAIAKHEEQLTAYTLERLEAIPGIEIYGEGDPAKSAERVGVIPFNLENVPHFLVAAILGYEGGIGVRSGCFCAHPYVVHLLQLTLEEQQQWKEQFLRGDKSQMPGLVRVSLGCYNTTDDIDRLLEMLGEVVDGNWHGSYRMDNRSGEYVPVNYIEPITQFFSLTPSEDGGTSLSA